MMQGSLRKGDSKTTQLYKFFPLYLAALEHLAQVVRVVRALVPKNNKRLSLIST